MLSASSTCFGQQCPDGGAALFKEGTKALDEGRHDRACPLLRQSVECKTGDGRLYALARCEGLSGNHLPAIELYNDYLGRVERLPASAQASHAERVERAIAHLEELYQHVSRLEIKLPASLVEVARLTVDDRELSPERANTPIAVSPGEHVVIIELRDGRSAKRSVSTTKGATEAVDFSVEPAGKPAASPSNTTGLTGPGPDERRERPPGEVSGGTSAIRPWIYAAGGLGLAGLALGSVTGALALSKRSAIAQKCPERRCEDEASLKVAQSAQTLGLISTLGFSAGLAGVSTATVLFILEPGPSASNESGKAGAPAMRGAWVGVRGTFQ